MSFKSLFIVDENADKQPEKKVDVKPAKGTTKFPDAPVENKEAPSTSAFSSFFGSTPTPTFNTTNSGQVPQEFVDKANQIYQSGFDSLNQAGYDFYEYYQTVVQGGITNPQIFNMAFNMGKVMDKNITKDKLLQQSDFYITEINKVYQDYIAKGNAKKQELTQQKDNENQSLVNELSLMNQQMEALKTQIADRENKLKAIGSKYEPKLTEIQYKLIANDLAKNQLVGQIEQVKSGISSNIK